jgi:hypothetical protein
MTTSCLLWIEQLNLGVSKMTQFTGRKGPTIFGSIRGQILADRTKCGLSFHI